MIVYSVTLNINKEDEQDWLNYMQQKHIADVLKTGYFRKAVFKKIIDNNESNSVIFNTEYYAETIEKYNDYVQHAATALQQDVLKKFTGKFTAERKLYEIIEEF